MRAGQNNCCYAWRPGRAEGPLAGPLLLEACSPVADWTSRQSMQASLPTKEAIPGLTLTLRGSSTAWPAAADSRPRSAAG